MSKKKEEDCSDLMEEEVGSVIEMDVTIKYRGLNGEIYETKEKGINCKTDFNLFVSNLKKVIKMLEESKSDSISDYMGSS